MLTVAEYVRGEEHADVLGFLDNIFRFTKAGSEVGPHVLPEQAFFMAGGIDDVTANAKKLQG